MFSLGDKVVYRHHVCEVAALRENYFEGKDYLELHALFEKSLKLFVAVDEAKPPALRPVMTREEANDLVDSIIATPALDSDAESSPNDTPALHERRTKELYDKHLKTFTPEDLVVILRSAHDRTESREQEGRSITATDKKYFDLAENLLCDELSVSLDIPREETKDYLFERIHEEEAEAEQEA